MAEMIAPRPPVVRGISFSRLKAEEMTKMDDELDREEQSDPHELGYGNVQHRLEKIRQIIKIFVETSIFGKIYKSLYVGMCVCSLFIYCVEKYYGRRPFLKIEQAFSIIVFFNWVLLFYLEDRKLLYLQRIIPMIILISAIPVWITLDSHIPTFSASLSSEEALLVVMFGVAMTRILRALEINYFFSGIKDPVIKFVATFVSSFVVTIIFNAAVMDYLEQEQDLPLHLWICYVCVTCSTVGYGDVTPRTTAGRLGCIYIICFSVVFVPKMTNDLLHVMSLQSVYLRATYVPAFNTNHIIICGDFSSTSLAEFFRELFHTDHQNDRDNTNRLHAVLVQPGPPSVEMLRILNDPLFAGLLTFIEGSVLVEKDLKRAHAATAIGVFVLADKFTSNPNEEDAKTVLQVLSVQKYMEYHMLKESVHDSTACSCVLQLIRGENEMLVPNKGENKVVISCNEIKMGILAKATMFPGTATLIMNLISSFSRIKKVDHNLEEEIDFRKRLNSGVINFGHRKSIFSVVREAIPEEEDSSPASESRMDWFAEYQEGCNWELYTVVLAPIFEGAKFVDVSFILQQRSGILLIGLHVTDFTCGLSKVLLNPAFMVIPCGQSYEVTAIVIAKNKCDTIQLGNPSPSDSVFFANALRHSKSTAQKELAGPGKISRVGSVQEIRPTVQATFNRTRNKYISIAKIAKEFKSIPEKVRARSNMTSRSLTHMLPKPRSLEQCTVHGAITDVFPSMRDHIIVIGKDLTNVYDLIRPLRARFLGVIAPIVILFPEIFPASVWKQISVFPDILVIHGNSFDEELFIRAGIFRAGQVLVLADSCAHQRAKMSAHLSTELQLQALVDADAILIYKCIKALNPRIRIMIEIFCSSNMSYLESASQFPASRSEFRFSKAFASGSLFTVSTLDSLLCQAHFNPIIVNIIRKLICGVDSVDKGDLLAQVLSTEMERVGSQSDAVSARANSILNNVTESSLYSIDLPEGAANKTYGYLFRTLAKKNIIPLGLFRSRENIKFGVSSIPDNYVCTNPSRAAVVFPNDKVFVLSTVPVCKPHEDYEVLSLELQKYFSARNAHLEISEHHSAINFDQIMQSNFEQMQNAIQANLEKLMEKQKDEFSAQLKDLAASLENQANAGPQDLSPSKSKAKSQKSSSSKSPTAAPKGGLLPQIIRSQKLKAGSVDISSYLDFELDLPQKQKPNPSASTDSQLVVPSNGNSLLDVLSVADSSPTSPIK